MAPEDLIARIEAAWADTPPPTGPLTKTYDDEGVGAYFAGTTWRGHAVKALRYHSVALSFFEPAAFVYYLPAFLIAVIETPVEADVISDGIVHHLAPSNLARDWGPRYRDVMSRFTAAQRAALVDYLYWYAAQSSYDDDACEASIAYLTTGQEPVAASAAERLLAIHGRASDRSTLTRLSLGSSTLTDDDLAALADFPALDELDVSHTQITSVGLGHIAQRPLTKLDASRCLQITDYSALARMTSLQRLILANSDLTMLVPLRPVEINLTHSSDITDFTPLDVTRLEKLDMYGVRAPDELCSRLGEAGVLRELTAAFISAAGMVALARAQTIRRLRISDLSEVTHAGMEALAALPHLETFDLPSCRAPMPAGFPALTKLNLQDRGSAHPLPALPALVELGIFSDHKPTPLGSVAAQPRLQRLTMYAGAYGDADLDDLRGAPALDTLSLVRVAITGSCLATLASLPLDKLSLEQLARFDERHLSLLAPSTITALELGSLTLSSDGLLGLRDCRSLRRLVLASTKVDASALRAARPDLEIIER